MHSGFAVVDEQERDQQRRQVLLAAERIAGALRAAQDVVGARVALDRAEGAAIRLVLLDVFADAIAHQVVVGAEIGLAQAGILDGRRQLVVAERRLLIEQSAPTADAQGGVIALVAASEELGREFAAWLNDLEKRGRLKGCRSTAGESPSH